MERSDETTTGLVTPARVTTGGNMSAACIKQEPSSAFMPRKYVPDGRVYEGLYERGATLFMSPEQEKLYLDRLWLDAQANPERSGSTTPRFSSSARGQVRGRRGSRHELPTCPPQSSPPRPLRWGLPDATLGRVKNLRRCSTHNLGMCFPEVQVRRFMTTQPIKAL